MKLSLISLLPLALLVHCGSGVSSPGFEDEEETPADGGSVDAAAIKDAGKPKDAGKTPVKDAGKPPPPGVDSGPKPVKDGGPGPQPNECTSPGTESPGEWPQTDFDPHPAYIPNDTLVITIDDGPDSNTACANGGDGCTGKVLDMLKARGMKATFFVNTENWGGPEAIIKRIVDEGHELGNHTVHHNHLPTLDAKVIESEITGVESVVDGLTQGDIPKLTLLRAPYGDPYQSGSSQAKALVSPVVAKHAVAINWNFDTFDTTTTDGNWIYNNFVSVVKTPGAAGASWGIFLIHSVNAQDVDALPRILDYIKAKHFKLATVEDVLCWKFGKYSKDLVP
jgi:peptidoglycan/xylan/chitin deacetylase (PgdA/CDA1 family)